MKTKINITNYITKGFILAVFAVSLLINTSAQKSKDFVDSEKIATAQVLASEFSGDNGNNATSVTPVKKNNSENTLEGFLIKAAGINHPVAEIESENSDLNANDEAAAIQSFLINAAGLNTIESTCKIEASSVADTDLENFLFKAAGLDMLNISSVD